MNIDPNVLNVILGLVVNGLTSLIATSSSKAKELIIGKEFLDTWELEKTALSPMIHQAITDIAQYGTWKVPVQDEVISLFLQTPEVEDIVRQVYSVMFQGRDEQDEDDLTKLHKIFRTSLTQFISNYTNSVIDLSSKQSVNSKKKLSKSSEQPNLFATHVNPVSLPMGEYFTNAVTQLFDILVQECAFIFDNAIDKGILSAHEAKSSFRHNLVSSELKTIQKKLDFLIVQQQINITAINDFEKDYRKQVGVKYGRIAPPNLDAEHKLPIDDLYVYPSFAANSFKRGEKPEIIKRDEFFSRVHRAVLLGNPGAGKSTLTQKLCYDLTQHYEQRIFAGHDKLTPILVILREYGNEKKEHKSSIRNFIETEVRTKYQLPVPPEGLFEYLLLNGRSVVIFDGLDELLDTSYRQEIRDDVQLFCNIYPSVPVLVTSREVGYEQAPLDNKLFEVFHLDAFDGEQVEEYVNKWFNAADANDLTENQRQVRITAFLSDSQIVPDLRSNPLMLGLLCSIYRQENYIPRYRPDVYEKCAIMLFERWDRNRKIYIPPIPEEHVRPLMEYLANWIYVADQLRIGVTEEELALKATAYLQEWLYESQLKAEQAARDFIDFCTGRAWVFTDAGTQEDGEKLYQFSHATFLEYFTASHLVRTCRSSTALLKILEPKIAKREWDVVAQLAVQLYSKKNAGVADELLTTLLNKSRKSNNDRGWNLLSFTVRCLKFLIPRPKVRHEIAETCIRRCIAWDDKQVLQGLPTEETPLNIIKNLFEAVDENCITIAETLEMLIMEYLNIGQNPALFLGLEIGLENTRYSLFPSEIRQTWNDLHERIFSVCLSRIEEIGPKSLYFTRRAVFRGKANAIDLIKWHGVESIYSDYDFQMKGGGYISILEMLKGDTFFDDVEAINEGYVKKYVKFLKEIGEALLFLPTPWIKKSHLPPKYSSSKSLLDTFEKRALLIIESYALFGAFALCALYTEIYHNERAKFITFTTSTEPLDIIRVILWCRFESNDGLNTPFDLNKYNLTLEQQNFILRWVRKEINLVDPEVVISSSELVINFE